MKLANLIRGNDRGAITLRLLVSMAVVAASGGAGALALESAASAAPVDDIDICHATGSDSNPYIPNSPSKTADAGGHDGHRGPIWTPGTTAVWGDIIPPFAITGGGNYPGLNWTATGQAILANGCEPLPSLAMGKTGPASALLGTTGSYVLTVSNTGDGPANTTTTVTDMVPAGWTITNVAAGPGSGFTCGTAGQTITCTTNTDLATGRSFTITVTVRYDQLGSRTNTATVSSVVDLNTPDNTATATTVVRAPDLTLAKSAPANVTVGDAGTYTLTATNAGDTATIGTITVSDTVPAGVTIGTLPGTCSRVGQAVTCTSTAALAPTFTVAFSFPVTFTTVGSVLNTATVSGGGQSDTTNDSASATTVVAGIPDLTIDKTAPITRVIGTAGDYVLTVTNAGNGATSSTITVSDTLPDGVTLLGAPPSGCSAVGQQLTCTSAAVLGVGSSVAFTVPVTFTALGTITNTGTVAGGGQRNLGNDSDDAETLVTAAPVVDLSLAKSGPNTATVGDTGSYVLTATNVGTGPTAGTITIVDTLPSGVTAGTLPAGCAAAGQQVTCTAPGPVAPNGTFSFTLPVTFSTVGTVVNNATVSGGGDTNAANNRASKTTAVIGIPDLSLAKSGPMTATVGDPGSYVLTATNVGNGDTVGTITVTDAVPTGVTVGNLTGSGCSLAGSTVTCTSNGVLAPAGTVAFTIPVTFASVGSVVNNAAVSGGGETRTNNNTASATTAVAGIPDLTLAKSAPTSAVVGDPGSYVLTATNVGNGDTVGTITVTDAVPTGVTVGNLTGSGCSLAGSTVTCTSNGVLAPAGTVAFTIPVTFASVGSVVNNAAVSGGGETRTNNNTASATTAVTAAPVPDLKLTKTAPATRTTGQTGDYTLVVENVGTAAATDVITVVDTLPAGVTVAPVTSGGFTCTVAANVVTCTTNDDIAVGGTKTITLPASFTTSGVKGNSATVSVNGDPNAANNTSAARTSVTDPQGPPPPPPAPAADLAVKKTGPAAVSPGGTATWVLTVTNKGPGNAAGFSVTDTLPVGVTLTSLSGSGFACTDATVVCTYTGVLLPGQTAAVTVVGAVASTIAGSSAANVVVVGPTDATPADNTDTLVSVIERPAPVGQADLVLEKTAPAELALPGGVVVWTIKVTNAGTAAASDFTVNDALAQGLTLLTAAGDGFTCTGSATVSCVFGGQLAPGAVATLLVTSVLDEDYGSSSVANTATAALEGDPTPENNTDSAGAGVALPIGGVDEEPATGEEPTEQPTTEPTTDPSPIGGVTSPDPASGEEPTGEPTQAPAESASPVPSTLPSTDTTDQPAALPFTGGHVDLLLGLGAGLSVIGLLLALTGRRRSLIE